ncbi:general substrate transporter [Aspergillus pseudoustus]|uniref:General substrate transporter n=1 Tax=Aspergillus pseudoustus TaxID=1810923 RepID=A0ABR4KBD0_9EURO
MVNEQDKQGAMHIEKDGISADEQTVPVTSAYATLTRAQVVRKFWRLYITGLGVSMAGMYAGYANSVIGSIVANEGFIQYFATTTDPDTGAPALDSQHISLWSACYFITSILIHSVAPVTADKFGRKFNMWGVTLFLTLSIIIQVVATKWWVLLIARLVAGCAGGMMGTSAMVYLSEMAMPQFRGALLGSFSLAFALGQVFPAIALKFLEESKPMASCNIFYSEFVFTGLWLFPMLYLPDTPSWYASESRHDEGKQALRRLVGNVKDYDLEREYAVLKYEMDESTALQKKQEGQSEWKILFTSKTNVKRAIISTLPFTFQNIVGVPLMFGYTTYFFQLAGVDDPFLGNIVKQIVLVIGIILAFYTVDKVGRQTLVIYGGALMAIICLIVGGLGFMEQTSASGVALVALCSFWAFVYANSLAPIGWISLVEISSPSLRAKTTSFAVTIQYLTGILFNYCVPRMLSNQHAGWGQKIGLFFGGLTLLYLTPCILLFPETKGRTYHELDELFERGIPAWRFAETRTSHQAEVESSEERHT